MKVRRRYIILATLFVLYFGIRIFFALQSQHFSDNYSYFALRQIENIAETGKPIIHDKLSYSGRTFVFMPLYFYILAFFTIFFPKIIIIKIINNLFASSIILAVYLICSKVITNRRISVICSIVSATFPIYINETLNNISTYSIIIPGSLFLLYLFLNIKRRNIYKLILLTAILVLSSSASVLVVFGLLIYIILSKLENVSLEKIELEYIAFFSLFFLWANFIVFKNAFQLHGFSIIWENTPVSILDTYFTSINLVNALTSLGFLLFIFGSYTVYNYVIRKKSKKMYVFISLFLSTIVLFWAKLVQPELGLIFMGASLAILFGQSIRDLFSLLKKSKLAAHINRFYVLLIILIIISQIIPGVSFILKSHNEIYNDKYISSFEWLNKHSPKDAVVLATPQEGHLITYLGKRKNVMDTDFLLIEDAETRLGDIEKFYKQKFKIEAIDILEKYNVDYIIFSNQAKLNYDVAEISYIQDPCFTLVYDKALQIYRWNKDLCELKD